MCNFLKRLIFCKKFNFKFFLRNGWIKDYGYFLGKKLVGFLWEKDYINVNSYLYNNVKVGDKSVKLFLYCMKI